mmetsp:Transcript_57612/g.106493  ORF Transcript_57612/g.106493 Transcript_57612/m.106493 type:complete len:242 (-) Transcript_57612:62-787(-)
MLRRCGRRLAAATLLLLPQSAIGRGPPCEPGEAVLAFFAGQVEVSGELKLCEPSMEFCYFGARIASGPDVRTGNYWVKWDDGDTNNRQVHYSQVKQASSGLACASYDDVLQDSDESVDAAIAEESFEIPCTILPRLHWEGQDPEWNKEAIEAITKDLHPDEVIDGFDWHVILRFFDADRCEQVYEALHAVLSKCMDPDWENCRTHKYIKWIEYVGDDPETRRKSGRAIHKAKNEPRHRGEL